MPQYRRKKLNLGVKKQFQVWLLVRVLGVVLITSLISAAVLYFYARQEIADSFFQAHIKIRRVSDLLLPVIMAGSLVSLFSGMALALFLPQKIAGPVFRIEMELKRILKGDLTTVISLRHEDILQDLAGQININTDDQRQKVQDLKNRQIAIAKLAADNDMARLLPLLQEQKEKLDTFQV
ncbi:MAG: chemotaxis protein [Deltaproteobacteria bacterium RIFOXYD12_FULL_50_9]|nr:MAG: chemotaxis protein [Deltaproteobacteria bacterium RIFOXYD12_FULL_50_9]